MDQLWTPWRMPYLQKDSSKQTGEGEGMEQETCIFCGKIDGDDRQEHVLARSDAVFVTLNRYPYNNGHLMIVPYAHVPSIEDLPGEALSDLMSTTNQALAVLREAYNPQAFNIGANIGAEAGAGIAEHFHLHVVPRWGGDTNYMTVVAATRIVPEWIDDTYRLLSKIWARRFPA